jgi:hypothetical protein
MVGNQITTVKDPNIKTLLNEAELALVELGSNPDQFDEHIWKEIREI